MGDGPYREASTPKAYEPKRGDRVEVWHSGGRLPEGWHGATVLSAAGPRAWDRALVEHGDGWVTFVSTERIRPKVIPG
jgi:hypothetical protein